MPLSSTRTCYPQCTIAAAHTTPMLLCLASHALQHRLGHACHRPAFLAKHARDHAVPRSVRAGAGHPRACPHGPLWTTAAPVCPQRCPPLPPYRCWSFSAQELLVCFVSISSCASMPVALPYCSTMTHYRSPASPTSLACMPCHRCQGACCAVAATARARTPSPRAHRRHATTNHTHPRATIASFAPSAMPRSGPWPLQPCASVLSHGAVLPHRSIHAKLHHRRRCVHLGQN